MSQQDAQGAQRAAWQSCGDKEGPPGGYIMFSSWHPQDSVSLTSCQAHCSADTPENVQEETDSFTVILHQESGEER